MMAVAATGPIQLDDTNPRSEVVLELIDDHFPLVLIRWVGHLQPQHLLELMRFYDEVGARAADERTRLVHMVDAREATLPSALVRDMLVDWLTERPRGSRAGPTIIIASNPLIRGVVTSLKWATGRGAGLAIVPKIELAIERAVECFHAAGLEPPSVLAGASPKSSAV